ncbi:aroma-sacti cluster domain-containing protein [Streptomyces sp. TRM 70351]|uniref:aroma-sacti cluster domain-containing protein n=1 Tax=Streptomyces sp. TRM 70351 TaxID=3116552 RepID=UPI002E7BDBF6|nr:aroma-sacti cluster domain-containing protein [Streptomyces sp. TRM 70351]MEE1928285.1 aroma-sacti cluster domain-containing protein [Streptomyces sp. TRM 70351]
MTPEETLTVLRGSGFPVDTLPAEQRAVLEDLTEEEIAVLVSVKDRLDAHAPEVQAHSSEPIIGGVLF